MNIAVFGLGYVGCISLGCLARVGHKVTGVDVNPAKVAMIRAGNPTILEAQIPEIIAAQRNAGRIDAVTDYRELPPDTELSLLCVGTPSSANGHLDLDQLLQTTKQIAENLKVRWGFHTIVIRSTVPPGTNQRVTAVLEELSGRRAGTDFAVVSNPEFLREGSAVDDYMNPPLTVIGTDHPQAVPVMEQLYAGIGNGVIVVDVHTAEMIKYVNNSFHALKVSFANEIGNICKKLGVDSHRLMEIFCLDRQLNISPAYLKPGFAYGGACLPKDLKALTTIAHDFYLDTPIINAVERSNDQHKKKALELILSKGKTNIGILGLSFKPGTDDLRNSPTVDLIEQLTGKGCHVAVYDRNVVVSRLMGANKEYIARHLPHISDIIYDDLNLVISRSELVVVTHKHDAFKDLAQRFPDKLFIHLVRLDDHSHLDNCEGICW